MFLTDNKSYFITLLLKITETKEITNYIPLLTNRLREEICYLVSPEQSTFIKGCHMIDRLLMLNEIIDWLIKTLQATFGV